MFMPSFFIKLIELGIATACLILQQYSYDLTDVPTLILCSGTYVGFILVLTGELIGEMVFAPLDIIQDVYFSVLGIAMFGTCGWLLYTARSDSERSPRTDELYTSYTAGLAAVNIVVMLCEMLSGKQDPFIEAWWSSAGAMLYGACAARTLQGWRYVPDCPRRQLARACAICALAATSVLIIDAIRVLCEDDGSSIASSHHKLTKARAPRFGLDLSGQSPICISEMLSGKQDPFIEAWWSSAGAILYGACAARTLQGWRYVPDCPRRQFARACAICALAATSVLIIDAIRVLCEADGSSIASSHQKLTKARAPCFGLELSGESPKCISKPVYTHKNPIRLFPFKVPTNDLPMSNGGVNLNFHLNNAPMAGDAPKIYQKLTPTKIPAPLRMAPKVVRTFW